MDEDSELGKLLADTSGTSTLESIKQTPRRPPFASDYTIFLWMIIVIESAFILIARLGPLTRSSCNDKSIIKPLYSPAQDAVEYYTRTFHGGFGSDVSSFQIPLSPELDEAWEGLYEFGISRISNEEAEFLPNRTSAIPDDRAHYIVGLDVFHQLHCLNMIRKALYPDHYPAMRLNNPDIIEHINHCVDSIRQSLECSSDISTIVWQWSDERRAALARANIAHTCRRFDRIQEWAKERVLVGAFNSSIYIESL